MQVLNYIHSLCRVDRYIRFDHISSDGNFANQTVRAKRVSIRIPRAEKPLRLSVAAQGLFDRGHQFGHADGFHQANVFGT